MTTAPAPPKPVPVVPPKPPPATTSAVAAAKMEVPTLTRLGSRVVFVAVEGFGKTTTGALGPKPVFICTPDEQGYITLLSRGLVPPLPVMQVRSWLELLASVEALARDAQGRETIVLDAMAGLEQLCAQHVCTTQYKGDWSKSGYLSFYEGPKVTARTWPLLLSRLTACARKGVNVLMLGHAKVRRFNAPDGIDYDRYECNVGTEEVWARTKAWAESVLFGNFRAIVETTGRENNTAKAHGKAVAHERILRCQYSAVADAKNTYGLAAEYAMPDDAAKFAESFWTMMNTNRQETAP